MPPKPVCHGSEYSPVGSQVGLTRSARRFAALGIWSSGSLSTQPSWMSRPASHDVGAMMSGSIVSPLPSTGWILAKYSLLSLYASVYCMSTPVASTNRSTVPGTPSSVGSM